MMDFNLWLKAGRPVDSVVCCDCLQGMKQLKDNSIDLVLTDPPYNIGKDSWDKIDDYENWLMDIFKEIQRVLKDNGSFYWFHSEFLVICDLVKRIQQETTFIFKQFIVWNKRFDGAGNKGYLDGFVVVDGLRNYQQMAEYILYYTFQDETGLTTVMLDTNNFPTLRKYFYDLLRYMGETNKGIAKKLGHRQAEHAFYVLPKKQVIETVGQKGDHCFRYGSTQWDLPTKETYTELIEKFHIDKWPNFREYESLRQEYESLRYTFNNQKTHHSVWNYEIEKRNEHTTPKPLDLINNILLHSSKEGDLVLDPFMGSGTTAVACQQLNRRFIGFELEQKYVDIAEHRLLQKPLHDFQDGQRRLGEV